MSSHLPDPRAALVAGALVVGAAALGAPALAHPTTSELVAALDAEISRRPADPALRLARAHAGRDAGHRGEALADLALAARLGAEPAEVELVRGLIEFDAGDAPAAERAFDRALALRPGHLQSLLARARARREAGRLDAAAADYAAVRLAAARPEPGWIDEEVEVLRAAGREDEALAVLDVAVARLGALPALTDAAIEIELAAGRGDAALARLDAGLADRDRASALARRGELQLELARPAAAAADFAAAWLTLRERPAHRRATRALAALDERLRAALVALGRPDPGAALCRPARTLGSSR